MAVGKSCPDGQSCLPIYFPVNRGARFSLKCATPSLKSSLTMLSLRSRRASRRHSASVWNGTFHSSFFITRNERGDICVDISSV